MKIYKVHIRRVGYESDGFEYFTIKSAAEKRQRESNIEVTGNVDFDDEETKVQSFTPDRVEEMDIELNKTGVMTLLQLWASHPDNG